jgi:hypothetical protein
MEAYVDVVARQRVLFRRGGVDRRRGRGAQREGCRSDRNPDPHPGDYVTT